MPQSATTLPLDGSIVARGRRNSPKARAVPPIVNELEEVRAWRHALHAHPEVAFEEQWTSDFIAFKLKSFGLKPHRGLAKTGVVATISRGSSQRSIGLRADMDALALTEVSELPYRSKTNGCMHACGHDGHVAMLLGAAQLLAKQRDFDGTVHFIFQPAEENEAGAKRMLDEGLLSRFPCDAVFALHNKPGLALGKTGTRVGALLASADFFFINVLGRGGHAASPQSALDPIPVAAELISALQSIVSRNVDPLESAVLTVTSIHGGTATNIIGSRVELAGTVRALNSEVRTIVEQRLRQLTRAIGEAHGTTIELRYESRYVPTVNAVEPTALAREVAAEVVGSSNVIDDIAPIMGADDFGWMLQKIPGNFTWLGAGVTSPALHTASFDFNDDLLPLGISYWQKLVRRFLASKATA